MSEKVLGIEVPPIYGYLHHAYHLSVAQKHPRFTEWFFCNYIQLKYYPETGWLNFFSLDIQNNYYPLVSLEVLSNTTLKTNKVDILDFIINSVNDNSYVWLYIDAFYEPGKYSFNIRHFIHESLIYGYNLNKRCLYMAGFDNKSSYSLYKIGFEDFLMAYNGVMSTCEIKTLKPNQNVSYEFDLINVKSLIEDYVHSYNTSLRNRMFGNINSDIIYGIEIYKYLKNNFENPVTSDYLKDIRPLHILWEHKKVMVSRIKFLSDNKYIENAEAVLSQLINIENKVLKLRNRQIKYTLTDHTYLLQNIINGFSELYVLENQALNELLKCF